ncbi:MAG TPA: TetR/AcrR family transcriptional regulator [Acidimicrobiales bacterium]|nr:TetR/AcrR family transcriptional regulator [Acidimicrobiales bacterium]
MDRVRDSRAALVHTMASLLRDQGFAATSRAQLLSESGVSNGSLYHHFPGGMQEVAEAALEASGRAVADILATLLDHAPSTAVGVSQFLDVAAGPEGEACRGCPVAPTALESPALSPRLRSAASQCFRTWEDLISARLERDGWPNDEGRPAASATLALVEGSLLLARVSGRGDHLAHAKAAVRRLLPSRTPTA